MPALGQNPVLTPIRRWVLHSRTHLAISIVGSFAFLIVLGQIFGSSPDETTTAEPFSTAASSGAAGSTSTTKPASSTSGEVTESKVAAMSTADVAASAQATAMKYAYVYTDSAASDDAWTSGLSLLVSNSALTPSFRDARPKVAVSITGPTQTTTAVADGPDAVTVTVPTSAGALKVHLKQSESGTRSWLVATPLPTLDTGSGDAEPTATTKATTSATPTPTPGSTPTSSAATATENAPSAAPSTQAPATQEPSAPAPVPGPIPIPDLDTPLPGAM